MSHAYYSINECKVRCKLADDCLFDCSGKKIPDKFSN